MYSAEERPTLGDILPLTPGHGILCLCDQCEQALLDENMQEYIRRTPHRRIDPAPGHPDPCSCHQCEQANSDQLAHEHIAMHIYKTPGHPRFCICYQCEQGYFDHMYDYFFDDEN